MTPLSWRAGRRWLEAASPIRPGEKLAAESCHPHPCQYGARYGIGAPGVVCRGHRASEADGALAIQGPADCHQRVEAFARWDAALGQYDETFYSDLTDVGKP